MLLAPTNRTYCPPSHRYLAGSHLTLTTYCDDCSTCGPVDFFVVYVVNLEESMTESFLNPSSVAALLLLISCMLVWVGFKTVNTFTLSP